MRKALTEGAFNMALHAHGIMGVSAFYPNRRTRSAFGTLHLIREVERTALCGAPKPRAKYFDRADRVPFDEHLCPKCRAAFEKIVATEPREDR